MPCSENMIYYLQMEVIFCQFQKQKEGITTSTTLNANKSALNHLLQKQNALKPPLLLLARACRGISSRPSGTGCSGKTPVTDRSSLPAEIVLAPPGFGGALLSPGTHDSQPWTMTRCPDSTAELCSPSSTLAMAQGYRVGHMPRRIG